ncbi:MAG: hypothetical protein QM639_02095 [Rhodocyclaceae bacterium]
MSSDSRKAALLLHAMSEADRQWALARLSPESRTTAVAFLDELRTLGIPADESLVREALDEAASQIRDKVETIDPLSSASPEVMLGLLRYESVNTIAWVLSLRDWPWREAFLSRLSPSLREDVLLACIPEVPPALAASIRSVLAERLAAMAAHQTTSAVTVSEAKSRRRLWPVFSLRGRS